MVPMLALLDVWSELLRLKQDARALDLDIKFRKFMRAYRAKFDPDQPRDERGQWTDRGRASGDGGDSDPEVRGGEGDGFSDATWSGRMSPFRSSQAAMRRRTECDLQYKQDVFQCKMVGLRQCYTQAMVRKIACEKGQTIPPLFYM